jgi:Mg-chelatase subunit ChlD
MMAVLHRVRGLVLRWRRVLLAAAVAFVCVGLLGLVWPATVATARIVLDVPLLEEPVRLAYPPALRLLCVLPLLPLVLTVALQRESAIRRILQIAARALLATTLIGALARPVQTTTSEERCAVLLVDTSESMPDAALEAARARLTALLGQRGSARVTLLPFSDRARPIPLAPGQQTLPPIARVASSDDHPDTDIASALSEAAGLCPPQAARSLVLVTDGHATTGDLDAAVATNSSVPIHVIEVPIEPAPDVAFAGLELPASVEVGRSVRGTALVFAGAAQSALLDVSVAGVRVVRGREVELDTGETRIGFDLAVDDAGWKRVEVRLTPQGPNARTENDTWVADIRGEGRPKVLYVEGESLAQGYLERALDRERNPMAAFDLDARTAAGLPTSLEELAGFDLVILSDVAAELVSQSSMAALERYVREAGGGLVLVGGEHSFGPGGFDNTKIEEMSPVEFDLVRKREEPSLAMMLAIDRSGSMQGLKLETAKEAARAVLDLLGPQDSVGVVAFDDVAQTVVPLQSATHRNRIRTDVGRIAPGGGTNVLPALQEAYGALLNIDARVKHLVLLTDGQAPWDGISDLVSTMRSERISVSTVGVGIDVDRALLEMIADTGAGRFHLTQDPNQVPQIFVQEASTVSRTNIVEEPIRAIRVDRSPVTEGIAWERAPYLLGYVATKPKTGAELLLRTERGDPLLARWRFGLGKVVVFTSDCKNRWAVEWLGAPLFARFWSQVARDAMRPRESGSFSLEVLPSVRGVSARLTVIDSEERFADGLKPTLSVEGPDGTQQLAMSQVAPGEYAADLSLRALGATRIEATASDGRGGVRRAYASYSQPWPAERSFGPPDLAVGRTLAAATGGIVNPTPSEIWERRGTPVEEYRDLWPRLVLLGLGLYLLDLFIRRIRFGRTPVSSWSTVIGRMPAKLGGQR